MQVKVRSYVSHNGDVLWLDKRTGGVHGFDEPCVQGLAVSVHECILNDILIYSSLGKEHEHYPRLVLQRLWEHRLYAKFSKCEF